MTASPCQPVPNAKRLPGGSLCIFSEARKGPSQALKLLLGGIPLGELPAHGAPAQVLALQFPVRGHLAQARRDHLLADARGLSDLGSRRARGPLNGIQNLLLVLAPGSARA